MLRDALRWQDPVRLTAHRNAEGLALYEEACRKGWEGLIAKRADAPYVHGRSRDWLKMKCDAAQEMVIGGWTAPRGSRTDLGALLIGVYDDGRLRYAGKVGTGFTQATLRDLAGRLAPLRRDGTARSPTRPASATPRGWSRASSRRSGSPSGPATDACGTPASWACGRTRRRRRWCANERRGAGRTPDASRSAATTAS